MPSELTLTPVDSTEERSEFRPARVGKSGFLGTFFSNKFDWDTGRSSELLKAQRLKKRNDSGHSTFFDNRLEVNVSIGNACVIALQENRSEIAGLV